MNRLRMIFVVLALTIMSFPLFAGGYNGDYNGWKVDPNDQVMVSLLSMVISDLDMCRASIRANYADNILSIGHINNAQSALRRTDLNPAYAPLVREILDRLGKIKFYLVMNDLANVNMRLTQLQYVIRAVLNAETSGTIAPMDGGYNPQGSGNYPARPIEIPVGGSGQQVSPVGAPSIGVPIR